jgi:hypothetical protein
VQLSVPCIYIYAPSTSLGPLKMASGLPAPLDSITTPQLKSTLEPTFTATPTFSNWAETYSCTPLGIYRPRTEHEVQLLLELAKREQRALRVVGAGHSPSDLMCLGDEGYLVSLDHLKQFVAVRDALSRQVASRSDNGDW